MSFYARSYLFIIKVERFFSHLLALCSPSTVNCLPMVFTFFIQLLVFFLLIYKNSLFWVLIFVYAFCEALESYEWAFKKSNQHQQRNSKNKLKFLWENFQDISIENQFSFSFGELCAIFNCVSILNTKTTQNKNQFTNYV